MAKGGKKGTFGVKEEIAEKKDKRRALKSYLILGECWW
jgi:hypothetical protein